MNFDFDFDFDFDFSLFVCLSVCVCVCLSAVFFSAALAAMIVKCGHCSNHCLPSVQQES